MKKLICAALLLAGCDTGTAPAVPTLPSAQADTCNAAAYASLIGKDAPNALIVPQPKRVYRLGDPVTSDFNPARINVKLDQTDVIIAVDCG